MDNVMVHSHALKHGLTEKQIREAWKNFQARQPRSTPRENELVAIGFTAGDIPVQMVAVEKRGYFLIIHAMAPPTRKVLEELGINERGRHGR